MNRFIYTLTVLLGLTLTACQPDEVVVTKPKLDYYIESFEFNNTGFKPQSKVAYEYGVAGKLSKYTVSAYSTGSELPVIQRYFNFFYVNNRLDQIKGFLPDADSPYVEYSYQYLSDTLVSKITENNHATEISSEASFEYSPADESVKVTYLFSTGGSFEYEFNYRSKNIMSDKTTRGSQLCNDGEYTYDQHTNPFGNLGYVDYLLTNLSTNNKLTEKINYAGCSFPSLVPESYAYEYDENGYPTIATTFYKSGTARSQKKFFYK